MAELTYYYMVDEEQRGPFMLSQMQSMWRSGQIPCNALYWQEGMEDWDYIEKIIGLLENGMPAAMQDASDIASSCKASEIDENDTIAGESAKLLKLVQKRAAASIHQMADSLEKSAGKSGEVSANHPGNSPANPLIGQVQLSLKFLTKKAVSL